jgi:hypothetical protein
VGLSYEKTHGGVVFCCCVPSKELIRGAGVVGGGVGTDFEQSEPISVKRS